MAEYDSASAAPVHGAGHCALFRRSGNALNDLQIPSMTPVIGASHSCSLGVASRAQAARRKGDGHAQVRTTPAAAVSTRNLGSAIAACDRALVEVRCHRRTSRSQQSLRDFDFPRWSSCKRGTSWILPNCAALQALPPASLHTQVHS
jgi:hypothetical protein